MEEGVTIKQIVRRAIDDCLSLEIVYAKNSRETSTRVISDVSENKEYGLGYISAYCHMREEQRTFKISKIVDARIVPSLRKITLKQLYNYEFDASKPIFKLYGEEY
ncbi:MAG: hypothetical protein PUC77_05865 [Bacteroidales bacterium]|nr:hypothetical protein [Bacteroidales bacterium]MDD6141221.1 hypothetical protein [Bacteroidales bacterium]MDD6622780.1 hypothetical protein [Bacteroidales bacterium]MDD6669160.1 hypothetical protein [Bacteroidales bacterium]